MATTNRTTVVNRVLMHEIDSRIRTTYKPGPPNPSIVKVGTTSDPNSPSGKQPVAVDSK
jgi:hypothetical protein